MALSPFVSVYAPILTSAPEAKDKFYENLAETVKNLRDRGQVILLGDCNARVGSDSDSWPTCLGKFGVGSMNENGQRLLEFWTYHQLCITNAYFQSKPQHKVSWRHPRSKQWHQLNLILVRRCFLKNVLNTRTFHSADCDTEQNGPASSSIQLWWVSGNVIELEPGSRIYCWQVGKAIFNTALITLGKKTSKTKDWFNSKSAVMTPVIDAKRNAFSTYRQSPTERNLHILRSARSSVQKTAMQCELSEKIQTASASGNIRGVYEGINEAIGPK